MVFTEINPIGVTSSHLLERSFVVFDCSIQTCTRQPFKKVILNEFDNNVRVAYDSTTKVGVFLETGIEFSEKTIDAFERALIIKQLRDNFKSTEE